MYTAAGVIIRLVELKQQCHNYNRHLNQLKWHSHPQLKLFSMSLRQIKKIRLIHSLTCEACKDIFSSLKSQFLSVTDLPGTKKNRNELSTRFTNLCFTDSSQLLDDSLRKSLNRHGTNFFYAKHYAYLLQSEHQWSQLF